MDKHMKAYRFVSKDVNDNVIHIAECWINTNTSPRWQKSRFGSFAHLAWTAVQGTASVTIVDITP